MLALLGAILALGAVLVAPGPGMSTPSAHTAAAAHAVTVGRLPATAAPPATPMAKAGHVARRLLGFAAPVAGSPAMPVPLLGAGLGLLLAAGATGRSRLGADRRRSRGPPAPVTAA